MIKSFVTGFLVLLAIQGAWFATLLFDKYLDWLLILMWISPSISALVVAYIAPRIKFWLGVSMALLSSILTVVLNGIYQFTGHAVDFSGYGGSLALFLATFAYGVVGAIVGASVGCWLSKKFVKQHYQVSVTDSK